MNNQEKISRTPEASIDTKEIESIANEQRETLRDSLEKAETHHKEAASQESLSDIKDTAVDYAKGIKEGTSHEHTPTPKRPGIISRRQRDNSFNKQMSSISPHLSKSEQTFGSIIHNKTVEKTSDALGSTLARPNALLAGSIAAFVAVTAIYVIAKYYGYSLSGFETIAAFAIGWALGLIYDYARLLISNKRR